jgi:hypothetical protein
VEHLISPQPIGRRIERLKSERGIFASFDLDRSPVATVTTWSVKEIGQTAVSLVDSMRDLKNPGIPRWNCIGLWASLCTSLLVTSGCNGPLGQFFILHNQVPEKGCVIPADKAAPYQGQGVLDLRVPSTSSEAAYLLFPLLQNDLPVDLEGGASANRIALTGFDVDLAAVAGSDAFRGFFAAAATDPERVALVEYRVPWSGSLDAGGGNTSAMTNAFPVETALRLRESGALADGSTGIVDARVRARGRTLAGAMTSDTFSYPIRVCDGCLIHHIGACPLTAPVLTGGICNPGQDSAVDCCMDGATLICPATVAP